MGGWGTHVVVYSNGDAYGTANYGAGRFSPDTNWLTTSTLNGAPAYGALGCSLRVLIRASLYCPLPSLPPTPPPLPPGYLQIAGGYYMIESGSCGGALISTTRECDAWL